MIYTVRLFDEEGDLITKATCKSLMNTYRLIQFLDVTTHHHLEVSARENPHPTWVLASGNIDEVLEKIKAFAIEAVDKEQEELRPEPSQTQNPASVAETP